MSAAKDVPKEEKTRYDSIKDMSFYLSESQRTGSTWGWWAVSNESKCCSIRPMLLYVAESRWQVPAAAM
jgi:hypothetical protein